jgi:hypothetical protein
MNEQTKQKRKPRYRRVPTQKIRLQTRDKDIINAVYQHRFLTSRHIAALVEGSEQGILRRLQILFHAGYLTRPPEQIRPYKSGSDPMVYGIGNKGAELLEKEFGVARGKINWTGKNREVKQVYLEHTLMVANFMVCLELACKRRKDVQLMSWEQLAQAAPNGLDKDQPPKWKVSVEQNTERGSQRYSLSVIPDKVFGLYFPNDPPGKNRALFFLEADRSTMPVIRSNFYKSSFFKKLIGYWESYQQDLFKKYFGFKGARMLTIAKTPQRIDSIIEANKQVDGRKKGSKMFLFLPNDKVEIDQPGKILERLWQNGKDDDLVGLLE